MIVLTEIGSDRTKARRLARERYERSTSRYPSRFDVFDASSATSQRQTAYNSKRRRS